MLNHQIGQDIKNRLVENADKWFKNKIQEAKNMQELEAKAKKGGFIKISFCSIEKEGQACADKLKESLHLHVRGARVDVSEKPAGNCIICEKKAGKVVYVGRQY